MTLHAITLVTTSNLNDSGPHSTGHQQTSDQRANLIEERERLEDRDVCGRAKLDEHTAGVQRQNDAKGKTRRYNK
jgi:hypothetical protein